MKKVRITNNNETQRIQATLFIDKPFKESIEKKLLANTQADNISILHPHITLIHPRNGNCTDEIFDGLKKQKLPSRIAFKTISIIEQTNGGKWNIVNQFNLK